jgi:hypothetical protein
MFTSVVVEAEGAGERTVKVAAAGIASKTCVNSSMQNWQRSEAVGGPVTGIPAVTVVVGLTVTVIVEVLVALMVGVNVACAVTVAVGEPC